MCLIPYFTVYTKDCNHQIYCFCSLGTDGTRQPPYGAGMLQTRNRTNVNNYMHQQNNGMLPEPLIWTYVVQLTSALRSIHQVGTLLQANNVRVGSSLYC